MPVNVRGQTTRPLGPFSMGWLFYSVVVVVLLVESAEGFGEWQPVNY